MTRVRVVSVCVLAALIVVSVGSSVASGKVRGKRVVRGLDDAVAFTVDQRGRIWYVEKTRGEVWVTEAGRGRGRRVWTIRTATARSRKDRWASRSIPVPDETVRLCVRDPGDRWRLDRSSARLRLPDAACR